MKTRILLYAAFCGTLLFFSSRSAAQMIRHNVGVSGLEAQIFKTGNGIGGSMAYSRYFSRKLYGKIGTAYTTANVPFGKGEETTVRGSFLDVTAAYTLFDYKEFFWFSALGGASGGADFIDTDRVKEKRVHFLYGAFAGTELEVFLGNRFVLTGTFTQHYYINAELSKLRFRAGGGIKYCF